MKIEIEVSDSVKEGAAEWSGSAHDGWYFTIASVKCTRENGVVVEKKVSVDWKGRVHISSPTIMNVVEASKQ
jgi:hypothetical protein